MTEPEAVTQEKSPRAGRALPFSKGGESSQAAQRVHRQRHVPPFYKRGARRAASSGQPWASRAAMSGRPWMAALDPNTEPDCGVFGAVLDFCTQQSERRRRERPCRMYGLDLWRSRVSGSAANAHAGRMGWTFGGAGLRSQQAQPTSKVRKRGDFRSPCSTNRLVLVALISERVPQYCAGFVPPRRADRGHCGSAGRQRCNRRRHAKPAPRLPRVSDRLRADCPRGGCRA